MHNALPSKLLTFYYLLIKKLDQPKKAFIHTTVLNTVILIKVLSSAFGFIKLGVRLKNQHTLTDAYIKTNILVLISLLSQAKDIILYIISQSLWDDYILGKKG